jgi:hypothetical protein
MMTSVRRGTATKARQLIARGPRSRRRHFLMVDLLPSGVGPQMGKLKAGLFGFFASFYLVAAAWFSMGPVLEFARWAGLGALDWVLAVVVFLGLLHLVVEVTSSLRRVLRRLE